MILARVTGNVFCSIKHPALAACRLLRVRPENGGPELVAVDIVRAGPGDLVIVQNEGNAARQVLGRDDIPARQVIVGVVDQIQRV
jgi:ethanolamine utilization protein EutN